LHGRQRRPRSLRAGRGHVEDLDQVAAPTLIAWAELDRILPLATCSARFEREIPNAQFRVLRASGTCRCGDNTRLVVKTITEWVDAHLAPPLAADLSLASESVS
jgi:pimeloyl-ACP methyl ester carboxylesterase